ncbi:uncharacterized protein LOC111641742 isoform X2 [Centruroides sculpturatus]|uniref:uncharacterized protein LOC111641742 isoform X2 n=1 Tax=Centruroides sculpturatus TaxID=218467 RepID=UPI000C6D6052|nr:uncharacterized protein LOC111641742 isoform X2 [Centruroides sculpturatus]
MESIGRMDDSYCHNKALDNEEYAKTSVKNRKLQEFLRKIRKNSIINNLKKLFVEKKDLPEVLDESKTLEKSEAEIIEISSIEKESNKPFNSPITFPDFNFNPEFDISWDEIKRTIDEEDEKMNWKISEMMCNSKYNVQKEVQVAAEPFRVMDIKPVRSVIYEESVSVCEELETGDQEIVKLTDKPWNDLDSNILIEFPGGDDYSEKHHLNNSLDIQELNDGDDDYNHTLPDTSEEKENTFKLNQMCHNLMNFSNFLESLEHRIKDKNPSYKITEGNSLRYSKSTCKTKD